MFSFLQILKFLLMEGKLEHYIAINIPRNQKFRHLSKDEVNTEIAHKMIYASRALRAVCLPISIIRVFEIVSHSPRTFHSRLERSLYLESPIFFINTFPYSVYFLGHSCHLRFIRRTKS